ncbi:MAG: hypothetical protein FWD23_04735 [Oscillospiraceae bacterium]|nr:hypothetical protein [Oscillospiraceae bacterium]
MGENKADSAYYLGNGGTKILILGNSITLHGPKAEIGWNKCCGMAASDPENDYVHLLYKKIAEAGYKANFLVSQAAVWERGFWKKETLSDFDYARDYRPDIIIFRLGENILPENCGVYNLAAAISDFIGYLSNLSGCGKTKTLLTTCFWKHEKADKSIREYAACTACPVVELGDLGSDDSMKALGLYEHGVVAGHPGDKGMEMISERIWKGLENFI